MKTCYSLLAIGILSMFSLENYAQNLWTGATSTNWNTASNWNNNILPGTGTQVTIPATAPNWPTYNGDLTVGTTCRRITMAGSSELTVTGNLTISANRRITCNASSIIHIGGNFTRTGTFNAGTSTVDFYGNTTSTITGSTGAVQFFIDGFETNTGWTLSGEFQRGAPQGLGGSSGNPDPTTAYAGANVLGVDLTGLGAFPGDYEKNLGDRAYQAISPTINCSGKTNIILNFRRWLGVRRLDHAYIDISNDNGNTWTQIWMTNNTIRQTAWSLQTINISAYANNQPNVKIRYCIGTTNNTKQFCGWNIDDVQITEQMDSVLTFYNLVVSKANAEVVSNCYVNVMHNTTIKPDAYFTNGVNQSLYIGGNALLEATANGMASYIDKGTTNVAGNISVQEYVTSERWHLVSSPISDATINTYFDIYLKYYNEPSDTWTYLVLPTTIPMNVTQGYAAWASNGYTGTTTVTFQSSSGNFNNSDYFLDELSYTSGAPLAGFNLLGNPFPCALNWSSAWNLNNMSGWMQIYDNGVYRGYNIDGSSYNGGTPIIPSTQGFWVRSLGPIADITIPKAQRVHNGQAFYKEAVVNEFPEVTLSSEINGMTDETKVIFSPQATSGFDGFYDLQKFENVSDAPTLFTMSDGIEYAVKYLPEDYNGLKIPVGIKTGQEGLYQIKSPTIANLPTNVNVYLEDLKEGNIIELYENSIYEFAYSPLDEEHRFNLLFKDSFIGTEEFTMNEINIFSFKNVVYIRLPEAQKAEIHIYDLMGKEIISGASSGEALSTFEINDGTGYYLVKVQTGEQFISEKVFIR
jgi:hypothetical protein